MKRCPKCGIEKPRTEYYKDLNRKDGVTGYCKKCHITACGSWAKTSARSEYIKKWRDLNRNKTRAYHTKWAKNNSEYCSARVALREAEKIKRTPPWISKDQIAQIKEYYKQAKAMTLIMGEKYSVDHIYPLRGEKCSGLNVPWNLQVIPSVINSHKSNKI